MFDHVDKITPDFSKSVNEQQPKQKDQPKEGKESVPGIMKPRHTFPDPRPSWDTSDMFKEQFEMTWQREVEKRKHKDAFDQIDVEQKWSERLSKSLGNERT